MGVKPRSWLEQEARRRQYLEALRQGAFVQNRDAEGRGRIFEAMRRKLEAGKAYICGGCSTMQEAGRPRCKACGTARFSFADSVDGKAIEEHNRLLRRRLV